MKKIIICIFFTCGVVCNIFSNNKLLWDDLSRIYYKMDNSNGYVYFEGFDFKGYQSECIGIEPMLARTLELLQKYYGKNGEVEPNHPFVFVGHSQGGLRVLAMSTYLKEHDPELYKQLKGVITLSGIDKGLKLLENRGANFRGTLRNDLKILTNGIYGTLKVIDFTPNDPIADFIYNKINVKIVNEGMWALAKLLLGDVLDLTSGFAYPIMYNSEWDNYAQVRDMVPQSVLIKKYVLTETSKIMAHKTAKNYSTRVRIKWKKGWFGIKYPTIVRETISKPKYVRTTNVEMKVDKNLPLTFLAGANSNTFSMADSDIESEIRNGIDITKTIFKTAEYIHYGKCVCIIGILTGSVKASSDCNKAAAWCDNLDGEISELIGEKTHDGLVALSSQYLPSVSLSGTGYDKTVLNNVEFIKYSDLNHITIADSGTVTSVNPNENPRQKAVNKVFTLLNN